MGATLKRPRPTTSLRGIGNMASQLPSSSDLKAISNSLSMDRERGRAKERVISAASFPDDDPYHVSFGDSIIQNCDLWSKSGMEVDKENIIDDNNAMMEDNSLPRNQEGTENLNTNNINLL